MNSFIVDYYFWFNLHEYLQFLLILVPLKPSLLTSFNLMDLSQFLIMPFNYDIILFLSSGIANMLRDAQNENLTSQNSVLKYIGESKLSFMFLHVSFFHICLHILIYFYMFLHIFTYSYLSVLIFFTIPVCMF